MILKEAKNKNNFSKNRFFTKSARNAFLQILRLIRDEGKTILLPAYIGINDYEGSGVFDVVQISRISYEFYPISENFDPEINKIKLQEDKSYCFLLIHYFGFPPRNFQEVIDFCNENNIDLIEDCAHTLYGVYKDKPLGSYGRFAFHSLHKILPTDDGGLLVDNSGQQNFSILAEDEGVKVSTLAIYSLARHSDIVLKRRLNYEQYLKKIDSNEYLKVLQPNLDEGIVPLNFPIIILHDLREKLYFDLANQSIATCALYYRLIPQINAETFPVSYSLSKSILNLPVHQDTEIEQVNFICAKLDEILTSYG